MGESIGKFNVEGCYNAVITSTNGIGALVTTSTKTRPKGINPTLENDFLQNSEYQCWGDNNNWPKEARDKVEANTILSGGLPFKSEMAMSGGITVGEEIEEDGVVIFKEKKYPEWDEFKRNCDVSVFIKECFLDLNTYANAFPQVVLNGEGKIKTVNARRTRAPLCRLEKYKTDLVSRRLYISGDFAEGGNPNLDSINKIPLIDTTFNAGDWLKEKYAKNKRAKHYGYHMYTPDFGNQYYSRPFWYSSQKWLEVADLIVEFKKNLIATEVRIKYHIEIHPDFWVHKYGKEQWEKAQSDETLMRELVDRQNALFETFLTDPKNDNAVLQTGMMTNMYDPKGNPISLVTITQFDTTISDGAFNVDSQEATLHILFALGLHPSLFGALPGKNLGGGSGSDARVAFNQRAILQHSIQNIPLRFFEFIRDYNDWPKEMCFKFKNSLVQTLDQGEITDPSANEPSTARQDSNNSAADESEGGAEAKKMEGDLEALQRENNLMKSMLEILEANGIYLGDAEDTKTKKSRWLAFLNK